MKKLELTLAVKDGSWTAKSFNKIEADSMIELCAQFQLLVAIVQRELMEEKCQEELALLRNDDNDIPF